MGYFSMDGAEVIFRGGGVSLRGGTCFHAVKVQKNSWSWAGGRLPISLTPLGKTSARRSENFVPQLAESLLNIILYHPSSVWDAVIV